jgi:hypothetical protein
MEEPRNLEDLCRRRVWYTLPGHLVALLEGRFPGDGANGSLQCHLIGCGVRIVKKIGKAKASIERSLYCHSLLQLARIGVILG